MSIKNGILKLNLILGFAAFVCIFFLMMFVLRPVPQAREHNVKEMIVRIDKVFEGPSNDIVFKIKDTDIYPYINRGLEKGLNVDHLKSRLEGQKLKIALVRHWTPLDWKQKSPTLAYLEVYESSEVLYDSINKSS